MTRVPDIVPVTDLRQDAAAVLERARKTREPIVITQRGRAAAVLISVAEYERSCEAREILELLARGEREIAVGRGHSLKAVLSDVDELLKLP